MYFITTKRMLEVCFSAHPNIQYRTIITSAPWPAKGRESLPEKPLQWSLAWKKRTESGKYLNSMKSLNRRRIQATI